MIHSAAHEPHDRAEGPGPPAPAAVLFQLVEAVAALPCLRASAGRSAFTRLLRPDIAAAVRTDQRARIFAFHLVQACRDRDRGLPELLETLHMVEGDSLAMTRVRDLARTLPQRRAAPGREGAE